MDSSKMDVLADKLTERYASDFPSGASYIADETRAFLAAKDGRKLIASDIQHLERKVQAGVSALRQQEIDAANGTATARDIVLATERARAKSDEALQAETKRADVPLDNYLVFATASEFEHKKAERARHKMLREKQRRLKEELDEQVHAGRNKNADAIRIEDEYAAHVFEDLSDFQKQQRAARKAEEEKQRIIKQERDAQLADLNGRRARDKARTRAQEARLIELAQEGVLREKARQDAKARNEREYMEKVQAENLRNKGLRAEQRKLDQVEEKKLQAEAAARLDEQERLREETYSKMKEKSSSNQQMFMKATASKDAHDREVERRANEYQAELAARADEKARAQDEHRRAEKRKLNEALAQQIAEFKARAERDAHDKDEFAEHYKADAERALAEERRQAGLRRRAAEEHRRELQRQMEDKLHHVADTDPSAMSPAEKRINLPTIKRLVADDDVIQAVAERLEKSKIAFEAKKRTKMGIRGGPADLEDEDF